MRAPEKTKTRCPVNARDKLTGVTEERLWQAKLRAHQLHDDEPGPVSRDIVNVMNERWKQSYLGLGR